MTAYSYTATAAATNVVESLELCLEELNNRALRRLREEKTRLNEAVALHRLPAELLLRIFFLSLQGCLDGYLDRLHTLKEVCVKWAVLTDEPALWGVANGRDPWEDIEEALSKSEGTSLDVRWPGPASKLDEEEFFDTVSSHVDRWRSIELIRLLPESLHLLSSLSAPRLTDLHVIARGLPVLANLFGGKLTHLRHLNLRGISLEWNTVVTRNLETLRLEKLNHLSPSIYQLVEILKSSPDLLDLVLDQLIHHDTPLNETPVNLGSLRQLSLLYLLQPYNQVFLTAVHIPDAAQLHVDLYEDVDDDELSPLLVNRCRASLERSQTADIEIGRSSLVIRTTKRTGSTSPSLVSDFHDLFRLFFSSIPLLLSTILTPPIPGLDVTLLLEGTLSSLDIHQILSRIEPLMITTMELGSGSRAEVADTFLSLLTSRTVSLDGAWIWPLSNLRILKLQNPPRFDVDALIDIIRQRYGTDTDESGQRVPPNHVVPLRTLYIGGRDAVAWSDVQAFVDVLGDDVVDCRWPRAWD